MGEAKFGRPPVRAELLLNDVDDGDELEHLSMELIRSATWQELLGKLVCRPR